MSIYRSILKVQMKELKTSFMIFWSILLVILIAVYTIASIIDDEQFFFLSYIPILFWLAFFIMKVVNKDFHYVIQLGATRSQFVKALAFLIAVLVFLMVLTHQILIQLTMFIAERVDFIYQVNIISWASLSESISSVDSFLIDILLGIFICCIVFFFTSLYSRFGLKPLAAAGAVVIIALLVPVVREGVIEWLVFLGSDEGFYSIWILLLIAVVCVLGSNMILKNTSFR